MIIWRFDPVTFAFAVAAIIAYVGAVLHKRRSQQAEKNIRELAVWLRDRLLPGEKLPGEKADPASADMADAPAERQAGERHFGSPGRASGWGRE